MTHLQIQRSAVTRSPMQQASYPAPAARLSRRAALKTLLAGAAALAGCLPPLVATAAGAGNIAIPAPQLPGPGILQSARWTTDAYPNYTDFAWLNGEHIVWAACYASRTVTQVNTTRHFVTSFGPYDQTHPLDVAFDVRRKRLAVASADDVGTSAGQAKMLILDLNRSGSLIRSLDLATLTGQGPSLGGAQGVAVDARGDYWFALAYQNQTGRGVVVKVSGDSLEPALVLKDIASSEPLEKGITNPNGIVTDDAGERIYVFSDTGLAHQFDQDGNLLNLYQTASTGYRGVVRRDDLWVAAWSDPGVLAHIHLASGAKSVYPCVPRANSVTVDEQGYIWVAGDQGLSVSNRGGEILALASFGASLNGLVPSAGGVYATSYDNPAKPNDFSLRRFVLGYAVRIPALFRPGDASP